MTTPPHGQVPEALRLAEQYDHGDPAAHGNAWKAAVCTELRRLAELEAQIEALSGVQALSAAPEAKKSALRTYPNPIVPLIKPVSEQEKMRALYLASSNLMAYLGRKGAIHSDGHAADVLMNCLNDLDGGEFDETLFAASPTPPAEQQAAPKAAPVEQDDHQILAITTAYEQGVGKGHQAYNSGKEIANPYSPAYRCDLAWQYGYKEGKEQAQREAKAAPRQEAQEPAVDDPTRWLTVVYRDISPGDEARLLGEHPKASAMSWSHAMRDRDAARAVLAKWGTQPQAGAVPQGWKAVPVNPTPEMWKAAKTVPDPNPPYPPHYGLVWDAMLAASPTPPAEQQAAPKAVQGVGNSGFDHKTAADLLNNKTVSDEAVRKFVQASRWAHDEKASLSAMLLSVRGVLASREAEIALLKKALLEAEAAPQQEAQEPVAWLVPTLQTFKGAERVHFTRAPGCTMTDAELIDHMEGRVVWIAKTFSDSPGITDKFGVEHKPKPLYTAPLPAPAPLSEMPYEKRKAIQEGEQIGASDAWFHARHNMLDTLDRRNVFRAGFDRGWNAALAAQGGE